MATTLIIDVDYGQLAVFASSLQQPFNDWTDRHVEQGFAWRPGSVSFRTVNTTGPHSIEVSCVDRQAAPDADALRVIDVPFEVPEDGRIEVGSIVNTAPLTLPAGKFSLRCELFRPDEDGPRGRLIFAKNEEPHFAIVKADEVLSLHGALLTTAQPA